ncbi:MAG: alginate lyase family protein, partial [Verrucomicrobiota bacterium]
MPHWKQITTAADVCSAFPDLVETFRQEISVGDKAADPEAACREILTYYRNGNSGDWLRADPPTPGTETEETADKYVDGWFNKKEFWHKLERDADGHQRWDTVPQDGGWQFFCNLNRHSMMNHLFQVYRKTGNPRYISALNDHLLDWFTFTAERRELDYGKQMQVALRVPAWAKIFYGTLADPNVCEAVHLLMLIHVPTQARHLILNPLQNNGLTMTINALLHTALCWPEFDAAAEWEKIGTERLQGVTENLLYPDGAATELTSTYHGVTRSMIDSAARILRQAGREVPTGIAEKLRLAYGYTPNVLRPDGAMPLNNDSDRGNHRQTALRAAERYERPDWAYMTCNGEQGTRPEDPPSRAYPWAGHVITRDDWTPDAHWAFFDIGPWGTGHQHNDKLHLSIHAYGRDLLVDSGRFWYEGGPIRTYALSGAAHNTVMLDDCGQTPGRPRAAAPNPLISLQADADFAIGRFERGFSFVDAERTTSVRRRGCHIRALVYLRHRCWLVVDRVASRDAESFSTLWHFHPDCTVAVEGNGVLTTDDGQGNLAVRPIAGPADWQVELVQGREKSTPQGWYSEESYATWYQNICA